MQLTERHLIKPNHKLYNLFDDLTFKTKNLYNTGLYLYRQSYFEHRRTPEQPTLSRGWILIEPSGIKTMQICERCRLKLPVLF